MTDRDFDKLIRETLAEIAPELEGEEIRPSTDLRNDLDLDSMDFLNFVIGLSQKLQVEIPETDYPRLQTPESAARYLAEKTAADAPGASGQREPG